MDRRDLLKVIGAGSALPILANPSVPAAPQPQPPPRGPAGTPSDPDLLRPKVTWEKVLTAPELATLAALCDLIIPADEHSPSASQVGVPDFINEWVSAPYDYQRGALVQLRGGLAWLNTEATRRFGRPFAALTGAEPAAIADDICYEPKATPEHRAAALVFDLVRDLTATGFYTTREGMADLRYVGNVPLQKFDGPPPEVLRHLGLA
jgi:hypothetical protein